MNKVHLPPVKKDCWCYEHAYGDHYAMDPSIFDQGLVWIDKNSVVHAIECMAESYRRNVINFLLNRADWCAFVYYYYSPKPTMSDMEFLEMFEFPGRTTEDWLRGMRLFHALSKGLEDG